MRDARPGDVLQFEDAVFVRTRIRGDGAVITQTSSFPHHTAIVTRVRRRGPRPVLVVLHQNAGVEGGEARVVQEWTIDLAEKRRGSVKAYRPVADLPAEPYREGRPEPPPQGTAARAKAPRGGPGPGG